MTAVWGFAGCPAISIPAASINGLPLGFQCVGGYGEDESLLAFSRVVAQDLLSGDNLDN
ncbi:amidase [compost metagenome]